MGSGRPLRGCPLRAVGSDFICVYRSPYLVVPVGCIRSSHEGKPRTTCQSRRWPARAKNKEQSRGWHLRHLTFDIKGLISLALNVLSSIILFQLVSTVALTLYFLVIETVLCTSSSMARNFKDLNRSFPTSSPRNSWKTSPIMRAFCKMS